MSTATSALGRTERAALAGFILRVTGPSGSGKTTLIERLVPMLGTAGYRVATVKSARHHNAPLDSPGVDTNRHVRAGSIAAAGCFADGTVIRIPPGVDLATTAAWLALIADVVLIEGGHDLDLPALAIEPADALRRPTAGAPLARITEVAPLPPHALHRDDLDAIAALVIAVIEQHTRGCSTPA